MRSIFAAGSWKLWTAATLVAAAIGLVSCGDEEGTVRPPEAGPLAFRLLDVNPFSPTHGDSVSFSRYRGEPVVLYAGSAG